MHAFTKHEHLITPITDTYICTKLIITDIIQPKFLISHNISKRAWFQNQTNSIKKSCRSKTYFEIITKICITYQFV